MIKPRLSVREMINYDPPKEGRKGKLRLDFNENTIGCSPEVIKAISKLKPEDFAVYPEYFEMTKRLARYAGVKDSEIMPVNATDEAIMCVMNTYVEKGEEVLIPIPTFAMFKFYASIAGANVKEILHNKDLSFPTARFIKAMNKNTKVVVLANPNNPTGSSISEKDILKIVKKAKEFKALVFIDEAYYEFYGKSSKGLIKKYDNVIVTRTFSKAFGLAGIRLGYILSNEENIRNLLKANSPYSISSLAVKSIFAALEDKDFVKGYVRETKKAKKIMFKRLKEFGIKTYPTSANFLIVKFGDNALEIYRKLKEKGILVRDRTKYPLLKGCLRIGIGTVEQTEIFLRELEDVLGRMKDAVILDIDGVLVDVSKSYRFAIKKTAEYFFGEEVSLKEIQDLKNEGGYNNDWDCTKEIIKRRGKSVERGKIVEKFQELYLGRNFDGLIRNEKWLMKRGILEKLSKKYKLGIFTGRPREEALYVLKLAGVEKFFSVVLSMEDIPKGRGKPDPYGLNKAMKLLGVKRAWYYGDMVDDMKAAVRAGIKGIGVLPPHDKSGKMKELLSKNGAETVIDNINQLTEVLE
ncbi:MAG: histidinol-phosphate transaminase [Candidatus Aenigmarchaeota archaeon]